MKLTDSNSAYAGSSVVKTIASFDSNLYHFTTYADTTLSRVVSGTGIGILKNGSGTLTLSAANTYTGNATISAGIMSIINTGALPGYNTNGRFYVAPNATLAVYNAVSDSDVTVLRNTTNFAATANLGFDTTSGNRTYTPLLSNTSQGALGIVKLGTNTLTLTATNTYTGQTNVLAGTLTTGTTNVIPDSSPVNIASGAILNLGGSETIATLSGAGTLNTSSQLIFTSNNNATFNGVLSSNYYPLNNFVTTYKTGTGTQTFSGATIRFGDPSVPSSSCQLRHDTGDITILGGTFTQTLSDNGQNTPRNYQMGINSGVTTNLTVSQSGTMNIKGIMFGDNNVTSNNTINLSSGGTIINAGETWFSGASGTMNIDGGLYSSQYAFEIGGGTASGINNVNISNNGILRANHAAITMSRTSGSVNTINITSGGILSAGSINVLSGVNVNSNVVVFDRGTYSPNANNITTNTSSFATYKIKSGGATFNVPSGFVNTFNPNLVQDATSTGGGLVKTGAGQLTFDGTGSTYTGQLSVLEGTFSFATANNNSANGVFGNSTLPIVLGSNGKTATLQYTNASVAAVITKGIILPSGAIGVLNITGNANIPFQAETISGYGSLVKTGIGYVGYANNTYSGGTTLIEGLNVVSSNTAFGTGTVNFNGVSMRSGASGVTITLSNNFILSALATFPAVANERTLILAGPVTMTRQVTLNVGVGTSTTEALIISGPIGDGGGVFQLNKTGNGVLVLSGQNTFSGPTIIQVGNMRILYPTIGDIRTTAGNLQFASGITNDISSCIRNNTQAVRIDTNGQNVTFASLLSSNSAGLTKFGTGTLTLSTTPIGTNPNGIRGTITANGGDLTITGTLSTASQIYVSNGSGTSGTLSISGALIQTANPASGPRNFQVAPTAGVTGTVNVYSGGTLSSGLGGGGGGGGGIMLGENNGGTGIMNIYGGDVNIRTCQFWFAGPTATLSMSAGTFTAGTMYLAGGTGAQSSFTMSGGTATITASLNFGTGAGIGTLNLNGGVLISPATGFTSVSAHVINFNGGTFRMTGNNTFPTTSVLVVKSGGCIFDQSANTTTINAILSSQGADGGLTKLGSGTLITNAVNTYTGPTTISAGTLKIGSSSSLSSGSSLTVNGGIFDLNGFNATVASVSAGNAAGTITNSAAGSGTNTLTITNFGSVNLAPLITDGATAKTAVTLSNNNTVTVFANANNTFSGGLTIAYSAGGGARIYQSGSVTNTRVGGILTKSNFGTGTIYIGASASTANCQLMLGTTNTTIYNNIVFNAAGYIDGGLAAMRLDATGIKFYGALISNLSDINLSSQVTSSSTAYGQLSGAKGLLLKTPAGAGSTFTFTLANSGNASNDYSGNTTISTNTTLTLSAVNQIPNGTGKGNVVNNGSLTLGGLSHTINGLSGSGTIDGVSGTPTLTVGDNNATGSFSGVIKNTAGTLSITKIGTGVLTLAGNNTYTGTTTISNGSIIVSKTTGGIAGAATFTTTALTVNFNNVTPTTGATYQFFPGATSPTGLTITLTNAGGKTGTYNYTNSTLTIN